MGGRGNMLTASKLADLTVSGDSHGTYSRVQRPASYIAGSILPLRPGIAMSSVLLNVCCQSLCHTYTRLECPGKAEEEVW